MRPGKAAWGERPTGEAALASGALRAIAAFAYPMPINAARATSATSRRAQRRRWTCDALSVTGMEVFDPEDGAALYVWTALQKEAWGVEWPHYVSTAAKKPMICLHSKEWRLVAEFFFRVREP
jgi:hypothetical protein